jgi:hypothetical protein
VLSVRNSLIWGVALASLACVSPSDPARYRLTGSGAHWDVAGDDSVLEDVRPRYPDFFATVLDPASSRMPDARRLRADLEHAPVDRRNFDALNAVAIAYYESNYRAEAGRGEALSYMSLSQRSAKLLALPWRAYSEVADAGFRNAVIDFFADAASGEKLMTEATAPRLSRIVSSLLRKEEDPERRARIESIVAGFEPRDED